MAATHSTQDLEIWKSVPGMEPYIVSNLGRLARLLKPKTGKSAYLVVHVCSRLRQQHWSIHSIVARAFIGPRPPGSQINHIDGNKLNNRPENLEYISGTENIRHAYRMGLIQAPKGSRHPHAKLNESQVKVIIAMLEAGMSQKFIAQQFGITQSNVSYIALRKTWKHVIDIEAKEVLP